MIGLLVGEVAMVRPDRAIILCGGVGYEVFLVDTDLLAGQQTKLWIHDLVREDRRELYGFIDADSKTFFEQLIDIDGVGHKLAIKIMRGKSVDDIRRHVISGDIAFLTSLSGVGLKTAQKIVLELKGVLIDEKNAPSTRTDIVEALKSLGYKEADLRGALDDLPEGTEAGLREALKRLGK